jgi:hypothetical protein
MTRAHISFAIGLVAVLVAQPASAQTDSVVHFTSHEASALREQISDLEARLAAFEVSGPQVGEVAQKNGCQSGKCESSCGCGGCWCSPCAGWVGSAELLMLKLHTTDAPNSTDGDEQQDAFYTGSRYMLGYMNDRGRSLRLRYFEFATIDDENDESIQVETLDLEYAGRFTIGCGWYGEFSGGVRWAYWNEEFDFRYDDTIGPVVGLHIATDVTSCFSLYGDVRQSYQFGTGTFDGDTRSGRGTFGISEIELGGQIERCFGGNDLFLRSGFAAQNYSGLGDSSDEDFALVGFTLAVGVTR